MADVCERVAVGVERGGDPEFVFNELIGHLAAHSTPWNREAVEMVDDRCAVNPGVSGQRVDRRSTDTRLRWTEFSMPTGGSRQVFGSVAAGRYGAAWERRAMVHGSASIEMAQDPATVFAAIADVTRMGEWSPECVACRWTGGATGPAVGAHFEGDNEAVVLGITVKRWTTDSVVTASISGEVFEFVAENYTTWRYELSPTATGTKVTESYSYESSPGFVAFVYAKILRRPAAMTKGMERTLQRIKAAVDAR